MPIHNVIELPPYELTNMTVRFGTYLPKLIISLLIAKLYATHRFPVVGSCQRQYRGTLLATLDCHIRTFQMLQLTWASYICWLVDTVLSMPNTRIASIWESYDIITVTWFVIV